MRGNVVFRMLLIVLSKIDVNDFGGYGKTSLVQSSGGTGVPDGNDACNGAALGWRELTDLV